MLIFILNLLSRPFTFPWLFNLLGTVFEYILMIFSHRKLVELTWGRAYGSLRAYDVRILFYLAELRLPSNLTEASSPCCYGFWYRGNNIQRLHFLLCGHLDTTFLLARMSNEALAYKLVFQQQSAFRELILYKDCLIQTNYFCCFVEQLFRQVRPRTCQSTISLVGLIALYYCGYVCNVSLVIFRQFNSKLLK